MRVLLATDGSVGSEAAADFVDRLPWDAESTVEVLTVTGPQGDIDAESRVAAARERLLHVRAEVSGQVVGGDPAEAILRAACDLNCDLIVVGASGHSSLARLWLGSVTERVARHAASPVLVTRKHGEAGSELRKVVVGIDSSEYSGYAVEWLAQFPLPATTEIRLVTSIPNLDEVIRAHMMLPVAFSEGCEGREGQLTLDERLRNSAEARLRELAGVLRASGRNVVTEIRSGDAATTLLQVAEEEGAALLVTGSHGMGAVERFLLGSVSEKLLRHACCSVLVVRRPKPVA